MRVLKRFPHEVRVLKDVWIPLSDGTRLSATIWLPTSAATVPVPAILEYLPYQKDDWTIEMDSIRHPYLAGHGYAAVRVDMRGSGNSDGILEDEYLPQEQADATEVIDWLARQPWCSGSVGMFGISWGGFNSLQVAALRPPALKAIISVCSTDDRYADDVHYMGGCVLASDMLWWSTTMLAFNARPPDPRVVGDRWCDTCGYGGSKRIRVASTDVVYAVGVNSEGHREILGLDLATTEDGAAGSPSSVPGRPWTLWSAAGDLRRPHRPEKVSLAMTESARQRPASTR